MTTILCYEDSNLKTFDATTLLGHSPVHFE